MSIEDRTGSGIAADPVFDGKASARRAIAAAETERLARIYALPLGIVLIVVGAAYGLVGLLGLGDYPVIRAAVATVMPQLSASTQVMAAVGFSVAYPLVFHVVGSRIAAAGAAARALPGDGGRPGLRAFGVLGALCLVLGLVVMVVVAYSRAEVLAATAGEAAAGRVRDAALDGVIDPAVAEQARRTAHDEVFGPDLRWTLAVLVLMAVATVVVAAGTAPWKKVLTVQLGERATERTRSRLVTAQVRETRAQLEMVSRIEARTRREELAAHHERELPMRFATAEERFRLTLEELLGDPEATTEVTGSRPGGHDVGPAVPEPRTDTMERRNR